VSPGVTANTSPHRRREDQPGQCREPEPVTLPVADPADLAAQHHVLVPEHEEFGILGHLTPGQHHHTAEQTAHEQVAHCEDHPAMISARKPGQARSNDRAPQGLVAAEYGLGALTAAQILLSWSHAGRIRTEAAFAMLSGTAPVPVSSGRTDRHRLNRLGDRQLNRALHTMAVSRMRSHPPTLAYVQRRRAEGKTDREIRRCIKRYLARHLYRTLSAAPGPHPVKA
jgi:transposase